VLFAAPDEAKERAMPFMLGKQPPRTDERTLQLARYLTPALPTPPASVDNGAGVTDWRMLGNDTAGDCAWAAQGHADMLWASAAQHRDLPITTAQVLRAYEKVTGYDPNAGPPEQNPTDRGTNLLDALSYWRHHGIDRQRITAYVEIDAQNVDHVKSAIDLFGCAYVGVELPDAVLPSQHGIPQWTVSPDGTPARKPNPANGHCIIYSAYDEEGVTVVTWGRTLKASWDFHTAYCDEIYATLSHLWFDRVGDPPGLNRTELAQDLAAIGHAPSGG
jgi:hypothetical protein